MVVILHIFHSCIFIITILAQVFDFLKKKKKKIQFITISRLRGTFYIVVIITVRIWTVGSTINGHDPWLAYLMGLTLM